MLISSQKIIVSNFSITINHAVGFYNKEFMQGSFSWYTEIITLTNQLQNRHFVILAIRLVIYILLILFFAPPPLESVHSIRPCSIIQHYYLSWHLVIKCLLLSDTDHQLCITMLTISRVL